MFQRNEIEGYKNLQVSNELKNRTILSVEKTKKRNNRQIAGWGIAVVVLTIGFFAGGRIERNNSVLFVNDIAVTYNSTSLIGRSRALDIVEVGSEQDAQITVPLEIRVSEDATVDVTTGTLWRTSQEAQENVSEVTISGQTVIYWTLNGNANIIPICTIDTGDDTDQYMIFMDEESATYYIKKIR